jgi:2-polyprenyl-3-methyl-5-hydroxy-6-metoxy-1,4-benzoquinol methylase
LFTGMTDRLYHAPGEWTLARCTDSRCGLLWLDPMPVTEDLHVAYETYYTHGASAMTAEQGHMPSLLRAPFRTMRDFALNLGRISQDLRTLLHLGLEDVPPGRVLELGAGDGRRVERLVALGWLAEGQDVDPNAGVFRLRASGVKVHEGPVEALDLQPASYDAIVMSHVIEHLPAPLQTLRRCLQLLKPGGRLVAVTPNTRSLCARRYGSHWMSLEPPRHLHLFNSDNLRDLARQAGFATADVRTTGANGAGVALASRLIRDTGRFTMTSLSRNARESAIIVLVQAVEALVPALGEECILCAYAAPSAA